MMSIFLRLRHSIYLKLRTLPVGRSLVRIAVDIQGGRVKRGIRKAMRDYGLRACDAVYSALSARKIPYWADHGTLLGIVRENGFIKNDLDIDFSVPPQVRLCDVYGALEKQGFALERGFAYQGEIVEITVSYKGVGIDFFKCHPIDTRMGNFVFVSQQDPETWRVVSVMAHERVRPQVEGLKEVCFGGTVEKARTFIPVNAEKILEAEYGDWRTPDSKTDFCGKNVPSHYQEVYDGCLFLDGDEVCSLFKRGNGDYLTLAEPVDMQKSEMNSSNETADQY